MIFTTQHLKWASWCKWWWCGVNQCHGIFSAPHRTAQQPAATPRPSSIKQTFLSPWSTVGTGARRQHDQDPALSGEPPPVKGKGDAGVQVLVALVAALATAAPASPTGAHAAWPLPYAG